MKNHPIWSTVLACVLLLCGSLPVSARIDMPLLAKDATQIISGNGEYVYTPEGALQVTAADETGVTVAVEIHQGFNFRTVSYLQMCVQSTAPFNIALKIDGAEHDLFPQTTGPAWYEAFQKDAPGDGEGVAAGSYTFSLDIENYIHYNELEAPEDGFTTVQKVYISLRGAGSIVVHHLRVSDSADFTAANGSVGTAASRVTPITTDTRATASPTYATYSPGGADSVYDEGTPTTVITALVGGGVLAALMAVMTLVKKRKPQPPTDEEETSIEM